MRGGAGRFSGAGLCVGDSVARFAARGFPPKAVHEVFNDQARLACTEIASLFETSAREA